MTTKIDDVTPKAEVNLAPGFAALALAIAITVLGFYAGAKFFPFGGGAIAGCLFGAVQMIQTKRPAPGYASFFVALLSITVALVLEAQFNS